MLVDGSYDVLVIDAEERAEGRIACEVVIVSGEHKGDVVAVLAVLAVDPLDLLGLPATLDVTDGAPHLTLEP